MPHHTQFDLEFRPASYWDIADIEATLLSRINGEYRKRLVRRLLRSGDLAELDDVLLAEGLSPSERDLASRIHPMLIGGEYLPPFGRSEVEIARLSLASTTADVISVRARRTGRRIRYRMVDEYETVYGISPKSSSRPLTLGQLIGLLDGVDCGWEEGVGITTALRDSNLGDSTDLADAERLAGFVTVKSDFYPQLEEWYAEEARDWLAAVAARVA